MDIRGLGETSIPKLIAGGFVKTVADIYKLPARRDELLNQKIFGLEKSTDKILAANRIKRRTQRNGHQRARRNRDTQADCGGLRQDSRRHL